ncbi:MAG: zinc ABC transporter substrate-binding protein, partial [Oscillospiraceae bacterium]|nr:zinc ABC transporter substrate-binding protein [Oscillospiraceae bacterium]
MKKNISLFLCLIFLLGMLTGCGAASAANGGAAAGKKLSVVTTIFPEYDWVRQILGDKAEGVDLTLLLDNGA